MKHIALVMLLYVLAVFSSNAAKATVETAPNSVPSIPQTELAQLKTEPLSLLAKFPTDGAGLAHYVARAVAVDPTLVDPILGITKDTSPEQAAAIGAGIVRGARSLEQSQPKTAEAIAEKVMRSDNQHLRITFQAIGMNYGPDFTAVMPGLIPPAPLSSADVGSALPFGASKLGSKTHFVFIPKPENKNSDAGACLAPLVNGELLACAVPLAAILASDAKHNGAVSTSPTQ